MVRCLLIGFIMLCLPTLVWAEAVTFTQAMREATTNRPQLQAAQAMAESAAQAVGSARSGLLPQLTLHENLAWTNEPAGSVFIALNQQDLTQRDMREAPDSFNYPPSRKDFETKLELQQSLYDPRVLYGWRRAGKRAAQAGASAEWSIEETAFSAFAAYLEVQRSRAALDWAQSSLEQATEAARLASERRASGVGLKADELQAQVYVSAAQRQKVTAANNLELARRRLAVAIGRDGGSVDIAEPLTPDMFCDKGGESLEQRADLQAMSDGVDEAGLALKQAKDAYMPTAFLSASYSLHDPQMPLGAEADNWSVGAGLRWEIFDGLRRQHDTAAAESERRARQAQLSESQRQASYQLDAARLRADEARLNLETAKQAVAAADESHALFLERYRSGLTELVDLLQAQSSLDKARFDLVAAQSQLILALGSVHYQQGVFTKRLCSKREGMQ